MKLLINAISLHAGGGKVVGLGIIQGLSQVMNEGDSLIIVCPEGHGYSKPSKENIKILKNENISR